MADQDSMTGRRRCLSTATPHAPDRGEQRLAVFLITPEYVCNPERPHCIAPYTHEQSLYAASRDCDSAARYLVLDRSDLDRANKELRSFTVARGSPESAQIAFASHPQRWRVGNRDYGAWLSEFCREFAPARLENRARASRRRVGSRRRGLGGRRQVDPRFRQTNRALRGCGVDGGMAWRVSLAERGRSSAESGDGRQRLCGHRFGVGDQPFQLHGRD